MPLASHIKKSEVFTVTEIHYYAGVIALQYTLLKADQTCVRHRSHLSVVRIPVRSLVKTVMPVTKYWSIDTDHRYRLPHAFS